MQRFSVVVFAIAVGCGQGATGHGGGAGDVDGGGGSGAGPDELETAEGCGGVYNPDQVLDYHFELDAGDWNAIKSDLTFTVEFPAQMRCGDDAAITVGLERKRSGGTNKVGLKVDVNAVVDGQEYYGLRKLTFDNGESSGSTSDAVDVGAVASEYLAWRLMYASGAISGRAALARIFVNGELIGTYVTIEAVDKRYLRDRIGHDDGWLYKKSGGDGDGLKTHETDGLENPYDDYFCFWQSGNACAMPSADELAADLPANLDLPQMLRVGAANAVIANTDGIIGKDNNYYYYDWEGGRLYLPWDLDTTMNHDQALFPDSMYTQVLFTNWRGDYEGILRELLDGPVSAEAVEAEIARIETVAAAALDSDPYMTGSAAGAADDLRTYWTARRADVEAALASP